VDEGGADPFSPQLLSDYERCCRRFGPLPFREFVVLWQEAGALLDAAREAGFEPDEVPALLSPEDL
jgi:hypothetical protein